MEEALARFRFRMAAANRSFLDDCIAEKRGSPWGESTEVFSMGRVWFRWSEKPKRSWRRDPPPDEDASKEMQEQYRLECSVKTLDDVAALPHFHMDGTEPPAPEDTRRRFLDAFQAIVDEYTDNVFPESKAPINIPVELGEFLAHTNGVYDPDFRHSGIGDFAPLKYNEPREEMIYTKLQDFIYPTRWKPKGGWFLDHELDIAIALVLDETGQFPDRWPEDLEHMWFSMYAYCRPAGAGENAWGWQVVFYYRKKEFDYQYWAFKTIVEFLEWYSSWDERVSKRDRFIAVTGHKPGTGHSYPKR